MNIKNLLLLLLLLTGFAACSSDKNDNEEIDKEKPVLSIQLKAVGGITKANENAHALPGESDINNYVILIYNNSGELQSNLSGDNASPVRVDGFEVGDVLQIVAFVNLSDKAKEELNGCTEIGKLKDVIEQIGGQNTSNLTMACTAPQSVTLVSGNNNVEISIARLASRIQISSIRTNFKIANDYTVTINNLSLLQVNESSFLYSNDKVEVAPSAQNEVKAINAPGSEGWELSNSKRLTIVTDGSSPKEGELAMPYAYAFENTNTDSPTQLLVNATLRDNNGNEVSTRNFKVTVNATTAANSYIRRNYIYDLGLTFEDTSFDMAALVVKVTIVPWGKVKQEAEVD